MADLDIFSTKSFPKAVVTEPYKFDAKQCVGCYYWRLLGGNGEPKKACHYLLDTGSSRLPDVDGKCSKYLAGKKERTFPGFM